MNLRLNTREQQEAALSSIVVYDESDTPTSTPCNSLELLLFLWCHSCLLLHGHVMWCDVRPEISCCSCVDIKTKIGLHASLLFQFHLPVCKVLDGISCPCTGPEIWQSTVFFCNFIFCPLLRLVVQIPYMLKTLQRSVLCIVSFKISKTFLAYTSQLLCHHMQ